MREFYHKLVTFALMMAQGGGIEDLSQAELKQKLSSAISAPHCFVHLEVSWSQSSQVWWGSR